MAIKLTPAIYSNGKFTVRMPRQIDAEAIYTCIAIRSFDDIYQKGEDVYETYYVPYGVIDGVMVDGRAFDFETERAGSPNIITLQNKLGALYYIPDTFITSFPNQTDILYTQRILSINLGPLPATLDITNITADIEDLVKNRLGISNPAVRENSVPVITNPTYEESVAMERSRKAAIVQNESLREQLVKAQALINQQQATIAIYEDIFQQQA